MCVLAVGTNHAASAGVWYEFCVGGAASEIARSRGGHNQCLSTDGSLGHLADGIVSGAL